LIGLRDVGGQRHSAAAGSPNFFRELFEQFATTRDQTNACAASR
jgi:hypothetical protein